jgi:hypothetical protein
VGELASIDAHGDVVRHLHIGEVGSKRIHWRRAHMIKVRTSPSSLNSG